MLEKDSNNVNKATLLIIGIVAVVVAVIGASLAFFTAGGVTGNSTSNTIVSTTASYGTTSVTYDGSNGIINMGIVDLKESTKGQNISGLLKFQVSTTATVSQRITVNWGGNGKVTNTFCQYLGTTDGLCYASSSAATTAGNASATDVRNEIQYALYECTSAGYASVTTTSTTNCTLISTANAPAPITNSSALLHTGTSRTIAAGGVNYYALIITILNKTTEQNYNQGKIFSAQLSIGSLNN